MKLAFFSLPTNVLSCLLVSFGNCLPPHRGAVLVNGGMCALNTELRPFCSSVYEGMSGFRRGSGGTADLISWDKVVSLLSFHLVNCGWRHWRHFLHKWLIQLIIYFCNEKIDTIIFYLIFAIFFSFSIKTEHFCILSTVPFLKLRPEFFVGGP